jgi:TatD DNase family protein
VIEQISLDKMLVETDAPFLPPQSLRGTRNEPSYVLETVAEIAIVKGISLDEVESRTTQTAQFLFGIE